MLTPILCHTPTFTRNKCAGYFPRFINAIKHADQSWLNKDMTGRAPDVPKMRHKLANVTAQDCMHDNSKITRYVELSDTTTSNYHFQQERT